MRVFVTGASGWIGSAVVPELLGAGHKVVGLARSDASAAALAAAGAEVHRGASTTSTACARGAAAADGVIHLAFIHDFTADWQAAAARRPARAIERSARRSRAPAGRSSSPRVARLAAGPRRDRGRRARPRLARRAPHPRPSGGGRAGRVAACAPRSCGCRRRARRGRPRLRRRRSIGIARDKGVSGYIGDGSQPLARRAPPRRRAPLPARARGGAGGLGRCTPSPRRACRPATIAEVDRRASASGGRRPRTPASTSAGSAVLRGRRPRLERADPRAARAGSRRGPA